MDGELPFYTMELLDGEDLRDLSPVPYREACAYLRDVASSLALLHARRLLHRDISPRNSADRTVSREPCGSTWHWRSNRRNSAASCGAATGQSTPKGAGEARGLALLVAIALALHWRRDDACGVWPAAVGGDAVIL